MKICNCCKVEKEKYDFFNDRNKKDGLSTFCKQCKKERKKEYKKSDHFLALKRKQSKRHYTKHREKLLEYRKKYYKDNKDDWTRRFREDYYANKEKYRKRARRDYKRFRDRHIESNARYKANKNKMTPSWSNIYRMRWYYKIAKEISDITGIKYEVDHVTPLNGINFHGLHCEQNLQVIRMSDNRRKKNKICSEYSLHNFIKT